MKLTYSDRKEIDSIIAGFTEGDNERIYAEVKWQVKQMKSSPLNVVLSDLCSDKDAYELASDEMDWQVLRDEFLWDRLTDYHKHEYALSIFIAKHRTQETA